MRDAGSAARARAHALSLLAAHQTDSRIAAPLSLAGLSVSDARREVGQISRELAVLERRIDRLQAELKKADYQAQARILEVKTPEYRRLVAACDRAKAAMDEVAIATAEAALQTFLVDLRRCGVFATPPIAKED
jgi:uncharacterized small protein (DUF1192 family)